MRKEITWEARAQAELRSIDRSSAMRILHSLSRFLTSGEGDVKQLQDIHPPEHRLRVGDYRVRFHDLGPSIHILSVRHRSEAYR